MSSSPAALCHGTWLSWFHPFSVIQEDGLWSKRMLYVYQATILPRQVLKIKVSCKETEGYTEKVPLLTLLLEPYWTQFLPFLNCWAYVLCCLGGGQLYRIPGVPYRRKHRLQEGKPPWIEAGLILRICITSCSHFRVHFLKRTDPMLYWNPVICQALVFGWHQGEILTQYLSVQVNKNWVVHPFCLWNSQVNVIAVPGSCTVQFKPFSSSWDSHCQGSNDDVG